MLIGRDTYRYCFNPANGIICVGIAYDIYFRECKDKIQPDWSKRRIYQIDFRTTSELISEWLKEQAGQGRQIEKH